MLGSRWIGRRGRLRVRGVGERVAHGGLEADHDRDEAEDRAAEDDRVLDCCRSVGAGRGGVGTCPWSSSFGAGHSRGSASPGPARDAGPSPSVVHGTPRGSAVRPLGPTIPVRPMPSTDPDRAITDGDARRPADRRLVTIPSDLLTDRRSTNYGAPVGVGGTGRGVARDATGVGACFAEHGHDATTVAEVLRRAGTARGALPPLLPGRRDEAFAAVTAKVDDSLMRRSTLPPASPLSSSCARALRCSFACAKATTSARITVLEGPRVMAAASPHRFGARCVFTRACAGRRRHRSTPASFAPVDVDTALPAGAVRDRGARRRRRPRSADDGRLTRPVVVDHLLDGLAADRHHHRQETA